MFRIRTAHARSRFHRRNEASRRVAVGAGMLLACGLAGARPAGAQGALAVEPVGEAGVGRVPAVGVRPPRAVPAVKAVRSGLMLPTPPGNALGWQPGPERCVTTLAQQSDGTLWVATEDSGVWRYDPAITRLKDRWQQFTAKDGLNDNSAYALAVDGKGRVWAGTLNHGVSVWNGKGWKNYGVLDGPLGERVFGIAVCPTDGDVWIATNAGLTRYSVSKDSWSYITRADGLPSDQIEAVAFDKSGNIILGTQCDGVALAQAADGYKTWRVVKGPNDMPLTATGEGLPSNLINDVLVARDGTLYAATTTGLAWSSDGGKQWAYVRGQDYAAKVQGLYGGAPVGWKEEPGAVLAEDYVSCLAQDEVGRLWIGHWREGSEAVEMQAGAPGLRVKEASDRKEIGLVRDILPSKQGALLARYDGGLSYGSAAVEQKDTAPKPTLAGVASTPSFPTAAPAPTLKELNALLASLGKIEPLDPATPFVTALTDDWTTQGDWLGRYGRYWASLNAMISPRNYLWGGGSAIDHTFQISPRQKNDALRYWVHWLSTDDPRSLEMPPTFFDSRLQQGLATKNKYRRQAELDDHGEAYPLTKEGPDIYFSVEIPTGLWTLSFYNYNKDGQRGSNRLRDYLYSIRPHDAAKPLSDVTDFDAQPDLAHSRQNDFRGGVYKRFLVRGPQQLTVKMAKNNSFNTILAGAFLDLVEERPAPYFGTVEWWQGRQNAREQESKTLGTQSAAERAARFAPATNQKDAANRLFIEVERLRDLNPVAWAHRSRPVYQALARANSPASSRRDDPASTLLYNQGVSGSALYHLMLYSSWESSQRSLGLRSARAIEKSLKWDGRSSDGEGFDVITAYLSHPNFSYLQDTK